MSDEPLPLGLRLELDPAAVWTARGALLGGSPRRLLRLSAAGREALSDLCDGSAASTSARTLGRRLVEYGLAHPRPARREPDGRVTVVIPVRDRARELDRCLGAIGVWIPVVVVDDGSSNSAAVAAVAASHRAHLIVRTASGGPAAARNEALAHAGTEIVAFLDSDCVPPDGWLNDLLGHFDDPHVAAVAPRLRPLRPAAGRLALRMYLAARCPLDMGDRPASATPFSHVPYVPTAALLVRRRALETGFDEQLRHGEDVDLIWRLRSAGAGVRYDPSVVVFHEEPATVFGMLRRRFAYGTSAAPLSRRHAPNVAPAVMRPLTAAAGLLLLGARRSPARGCLAAALLGFQGVAGARDLVDRGLDRSTAIRASAQASVSAATSIARYAATAGAPLALARRRPVPLGLIALGAVLQERRRGAGLGLLRWTALSLADDGAYGAGVWWGCLRERTLAPLVPHMPHKRVALHPFRPGTPFGLARSRPIARISVAVHAFKLLFAVPHTPASRPGARRWPHQPRRRRHPLRRCRCTPAIPERRGATRPSC